MKAKLWIARDKFGSLALYNTKPKRLSSVFQGEDCGLNLDRNCHPEITWDNSPQQIEI